jgi:hypothetical protein
MVYFGRSAAWYHLRRYLLVLLLIATFAACLEETFGVTGTVKSVHGPVFVQRGSNERSAIPGLRVKVNDTIYSGADASSGLILHDGTRLRLGPDSPFRIERFIFDRVNGKLVLFVRVLKGLFAYPSGKIAHASPNSVRLDPPGTIGWRGTKMCCVAREYRSKRRMIRKPLLAAFCLLVLLLSFRHKIPVSPMVPANQFGGGSVDLTQGFTTLAVAGPNQAYGNPSSIGMDYTQRLIGAALNFLPQLEQSFRAYSEFARDTITEESKVALQQAVENIKTRSSKDMSMVGHADTSEDAPANCQLARLHATTVAAELTVCGVAVSVISVQSRAVQIY